MTALGAASGMEWAAKYVGIPFVESGCDWKGCNCWGLVRLVLRAERDIDVPTYGEIFAADLVAAARAMRRDSVVAPWVQVGAPQPFDVVLMTAMEGRDRLIGHAGIMSSGIEVLHVEKATHAVNVPITHPRVRYRIMGFYRHSALEASHGLA